MVFAPGRNAVNLCHGTDSSWLRLTQVKYSSHNSQCDSDDDSRFKLFRAPTGAGLRK
jgi:hypothetical protein